MFLHTRRSLTAPPFTLETSCAHMQVFCHIFARKSMKQTLLRRLCLPSVAYTSMPQNTHKSCLSQREGQNKTTVVHVYPIYYLINTYMSKLYVILEACSYLCAHKAIKGTIISPIMVFISHIWRKTQINSSMLMNRLTYNKNGTTYIFWLYLSTHHIPSSIPCYISGISCTNVWLKS